MMALLNILPTWVVLLGRDLILSLAGGGPPPSSPLAPRSTQAPAPR
jgi:hypothetical protein